VPQPYPKNWALQTGFAWPYFYPIECPKNKV